MNKLIGINNSRFRWNTIGYGFMAFHIVPLSVLVWKTAPWMTGDSRRYLALADSLTNGTGFGLMFDSIYEPEGFRLPGYSLFIAFCQSLAGGRAWGIILVQGALFLVSVWLIWRLAAKTFGDLTGVLFLALSCAYPFIAYSVGQISPEIPCVFLISLAFYLLSVPTPVRAGAAAFFIALSVYFRPNLILLK